MEQPPTSVGPYRLEETLVEGESATLHRARHVETSTEVALLVIPAASLPPRTRARIVREGKLQSEVPHPAIVPLLEAGEDGDKLYLATALVAGTTLRARLEHGPLPVEDVLTLGSKLASALAHAHELGILHRGLSPDNVLLDEKGEPLVSELGLTAPIGPDSALPDGAAYLSPEQASGASALVDARSDVWALGAILHEALGGKPAFSGHGQELVRVLQHQEPAPLTPARSPREHDAHTVILRCLEKDPALRYQAAPDLAQDCRRALRSEPLAATRHGTFARRRRALAKRPGLLAAVAAGATLTALLAAGLALILEKRRAGAVQDLVALQQETAREEAERRIRTAADARVALGYQVRALAADARSLIAANASPDEVKQTVQSIVALDPSEASLVLAGKLALAGGLSEEARVFLMRAARTTPGLDGLLALAEAQESWGEAAAATYDELLSRARTQGESDARVLAARAAREPDPRLGLLLLGQALDHEGHSSALHVRRALLRERAGELDGALVDLEAATRLDPSSADAFCHAARILGEKGEAALALTAAERALALAPRGATGWLARARARWALGLLREAHADADRALAARPDLAPAFALRGALRAQEGDGPGGLADLDRAVELAPGLVEARVARVRVKLDRGEVADALAEAEAAIKISPLDPLVFEARAGVLEKKGDRAAAALDLRRAIELWGPRAPRSARLALERLGRP